MLNGFKGFVEGLVRLVQGGKATEAGKISNQSKDPGIELASYAWYAINHLQALYEHDLYSSRFALLFMSLKDRIDKMEKENPSTKNFAITKFCHLIVENVELYKELENLNNLAKNFGTPGSTNHEEFRSQLRKIITDFKLQNLADKVGFLGLLKEERDFTAIQKAYRDKWNFYDLINDKDFKQTYIDKAVTESAGKSFKKDIDKCVELVEQGKDIASKYFEEKVGFQAYCEEIDNNNRVLNVNLINYDKSKPIRISDILQQEKNVGKLNICSNKKHDIHAYREGKERHYEFKEGAHYEMTSTWPVEDGSGNVSMCTMVMNVSSDGITEILKFNGEDFVSSEEILKLIKQNDELYIQGLSLYDAVKKSLEKSKAVVLPDVVPTANNNLQNESIRVNQDKEPEGKSKVPDLECDADNSFPPFSTKGIATQTEINSQQTETKTEVNLQHTGTQIEVTSQQMDELILNNQMLSKKNVELKQEMSNLKKGAEELKSELKESKKELYRVQEGKSNLEDKLDQLERSNKEMNENQEQLLQEASGLKKSSSHSEGVIQELSDKLKNASEEKKKVNKELVKAKQEIEELGEKNNSLQAEHEKKERGSKAEIDAMYKKLTPLEKKLEEQKEEFKSVYEEKRKLEGELKIVNVEKKELEDKLKKFEKEIDQAEHTMKEKEQSISNLKRQMQGLEDEYKDKLESSEQEIDKLTWRVKELENELERKKEEYEQYYLLLEKENEWGNELEKMLEESSKTIGGTGDKPCSDIKETESLSQVKTKMLTVNKLTSMKHMLTEGVSNEPDNLPLEGERRSLRSSSIDDGYGSGKENCDDDLSSNITTTSIETVAESRNVGS